MKCVLIKGYNTMVKQFSLYSAIVFSLFFLLMPFFDLRAQQPLHVALVSDAQEHESQQLEDAIKFEIRALLSSQYELIFTEVFTNGNIAAINEEIVRIYNEREVDVVIGVGVLSSMVISRQKAFPIPSIASLELVGAERSMRLVPTTNSGVFNYTFIESPFNLSGGLDALKEICRCSKLAVLSQFDLSDLGMSASEFLPNAEIEVEWIVLEPDLNNTISKISADVGGVYVLSPMTKYADTEARFLFNEFIERKLPAISLFDIPMLEHGAYAAYQVSDNIGKIPRRIALHIEKIAAGVNAKDLAVGMESFSNQLIINMETVNKLALYPSWSLLDNALLVKINKPHTQRVLSLKSAIAEGIERNLGYLIESKQTQLNAQDVKLARSNYLPQLDMESTGFFLDENTVNSSFGRLGSFNWTAGASFSQIVFSEPALANFAIQKLLYDSQKQAQRQSELDVVLEVAQRYFTYLQVLTVADLQNNNIRAVSQNLVIAQNKLEAGYTGSSDVYRWQSELDLAKSELHTTNAQLRAAGYQLNETLNRPIGEAFAIESTAGIDQFIAEFDPIFLSMIQDQSEFSKFTDFLVHEARQNLPEIQQIQLAIAAQERLLRSNRRAFYLPSFGFGAEYEYPIETINPGEPLPIPGVEISNLPSWNAGFNVTIPLFARASRAYEKKKTELGLFQLQDQFHDVNNLLELQVRANTERTSAAYMNIRLTERAAASAEKNIEIVRDLYQSGQVDIITLVDAQHSVLGAQLNAANARYQFMLEFFALQRSIGNYTIFATEVQRAEFLQRFLNFKTD